MKKTPLSAADTIVAAATAAGEGAIAIVRLSGPAAFSILSRLFRSSCATETFPPRRLLHGRIVDTDGAPVDDVMAVFFQTPHSYTAEDIAEIHCHGNPLLVRRLIDLCLDAGARMAHPGEFTQRAFLNGKLDLTQAEAVADLIHSRSVASQRMALQQLDGRLHQRIAGFREALAELLALVEAHVDFPEEDIERPLSHSMQLQADLVCRQMQELLATFDTGRVLRDGLAVLILGRPNVGKSSLLNALLGESRAIVTDIPGTTRDLIEEQLQVGGIPLRLVDAAGIRETADLIEAEGVRRTRERAASADLVLLVIDGHQGVLPEDRLALAACERSRVLLVVNKFDLPQQPLPVDFADLPRVTVAARTGAGLESLRQALVATAHGESTGGESFFLSDRRHRDALLRAERSARQFQSGLADGMAHEYLALDLRDALDALGEITGETTPDEILGRIFARFCIGK